tara:strand:- start:39762 stop:40853 length:1092 start_codon:yes stop_codon:yes gene_type:complete
MSNEILNAVSEVVDTVKDRLAKQDKEIKSLDRAITDLAQRNDSYRSIPGSRSSGFGQVKNVFESSATLKSIQAGEQKGGIIKLDDVSIKSLFDSYSGSGDTQAQRSPVLGENVTPRLDLISVLPTLPVTSNTFEFLQLNGYTNAAGYQFSEGDAKAEATVPTQTIKVDIATIAHWLPVSMQVMADNDALMMQVRQLLINGVRKKLIAEIISGASTSGGIEGLETQATSYVATGGVELADAVGGAIASLNASGWNASHVIMHPNDWHAIQSERTSAGEYVAAGWSSVANLIWGVPVIVDENVTQQSPLVIDASQIALLDRMQPQIDIGVRNEQFTNNERTILAECRAGLAVFSPSAILSVTVAS